MKVVGVQFKVQLPKLSRKKFVHTFDWISFVFSVHWSILHSNKKHHAFRPAFPFRRFSSISLLKNRNANIVTHTLTRIHKHSIAFAKCSNHTHTPRENCEMKWKRQWDDSWIFRGSSFCSVAWILSWFTIVIPLLLRRHRCF